MADPWQAKWTMADSGIAGQNLLSRGMPQHTAGGEWCENGLDCIGFAIYPSQHSLSKCCGHSHDEDMVSFRGTADDG